MGKRTRDIKREPNTPLPNLKQEAFCQLYATDPAIMGNGTQCYLAIYGNTADTTGKTISIGNARVRASNLLTNSNITARINELLSKEGFNDENVTKQHLFLLNQGADLSAKKGAVELYYKVKGKLEEKKRVEGNLILTWADEDSDPIQATKLGKEITRL